MKTTLKILSLVSFLSLSFASVAHAGEAARQGQVNVSAAAAKSVVAGPAVIHVYSGFAGAKVFVADGDGVPDVVLWIDGNNHSGYMLVYGNFEKHAEFEWPYQ